MDAAGALVWPGSQSPPCLCYCTMHAPQEKLGDTASPTVCHKVLGTGLGRESQEELRLPQPPNCAPREVGLCDQGSANVFGMQGEILSLPRKKIKLYRLFYK